MAITIPTAPVSPARLSDSLQFSFNMSDVGDGTSTKKYIKYRIRKEGVAITDWMPYEPTANVQFPISIGPSAKRDLITELPPLEAATFATVGVSQTGMSKSFDVEYIELTKNLGSSDAPVEGSAATSASIQVVNTSENFYEDEGLTETRVMTSRPCLTKMWEQGEDWIYVWAVGTINVVFVIYDKAGNVVANHSVSCAGGAGELFRVQCGPYSARKLVSTAAWYTYVVAGETYKVIIEDYDEDFKCIFQEKQGGYAGMTFKLGDRGANMLDVRSKKYTAPSNAGSIDKRHNGGVSILSKTSNRVITLLKNVEAYVDNDEWLNEFVESESYIITYRGKTVKAAIVAGTYGYGNNENNSIFSCQMEILPEQKRPSNSK
jgi:hypothetical protein